MKIKTWLLISYLLMMVLPLISAYFLFISINNYYDEQKVDEYYEIREQIQSIKVVLRNPDLYEGQLDEEKLDDLSNETIQLKLYRNDGVTVYSTIREPFSLPNIEMLYKDLYEIEESLNTFTYKEPVFDEGEVVGLFEVKLYREQFVQTMVERTWVIFGIFIMTFIFLYVLMAYIVHRKINRRLNQLMEEMSAFAQGKSYPETKIATDEIGQLQNHFYRMRKQITDAQNAIKTEQKEKEYMVAAISHDLKTPLTSIKAYAEALQQADTFTVDQRHEYEQIIIEKADFMKQMLEDLMTYTLLQSKDYQLDKVLVDGTEVFDMLFSDYEAISEANNVELVKRNMVHSALSIDVKEMIRVIDNLVSNAIQHTAEHRYISLLAFEDYKDVAKDLFPFLLSEMTFDEKYVYIVVQNEGKGIEKDKLDYLFDPLYQVDIARSKKEAIGTGMGLSVAKKIIEMHRGNIYVHTKDSVGVCFVCALPKYREEIK